MSVTVVSIGTTHPANAAGIGLDARIAAAYGVRHASAIAAVSAQDAAGVHALHVVPPAMLRAQLQSLPSAAAYRLGALGNSVSTEIVGAFLAAATVPIVIDPVLRASAGGSLYEDDPSSAQQQLILHSRAIVTPNVAEAQHLTALQIDGVDAMIAAGRQLVTRGARAALVKGGHLTGDPVDVLVEDAEAQAFRGSRLEGNTRGTGCTLAMALACELALGRSLREAVQGARAYVRANIARP
jgi:hydroxymethylpyrimidine kinase/phosphomethylpyrimidine kinase